MLAAERIIPERQCTTTHPCGLPSRVQARPNIVSCASMCSLSEHNNKDQPEPPYSKSQCTCLGHCTLDTKVTLALLNTTISTPLSTSVEVLTHGTGACFRPSKQLRPGREARHENQVVDVLPQAHVMDDLVKLTPMMP